MLSAPNNSSMTLLKREREREIKGAEEMAQLSSALPALAEDPKWVSCTCIRQLTTAVTADPKKLMSSSVLLGHLHKYTQVNKYKNKALKKELKEIQKYF